MFNRILLISIALLFFSCGNEKVLQLPEIKNADITEVLDVSPAYIFYDETKQDSVELNRKNLIISTNWLVNVDKRLTLKQALPSIIKLQEKKRNATVHKNEKARNYYTCNDTSIKNLGFIDFTDVVYINENIGFEVDSTKYLQVLVFNLNEIKLITSENKLIECNFDQLSKLITNEFNSSNNLEKVYFGFSNKLSFQDYISIKSFFAATKNIEISKNELIFD